MTFHSDNNAPLPLDVARLSQQLRDATPPEPTDALLDCIVNSRANGVRVLVTDTIEPGAARRRRWPWVVLAACAAGGAFLVWGEQPNNARPVVSTNEEKQTDTASSAPSSRAPVADLLSPWPRMAYAQSAPGSRPAAFTPIGGLQPERIRMGRRTYTRLSANAYHTLLPHETYELEIDTARLGSISTVRLVTTRLAPHALEGDGAPMADTLWLDRQSLRPRLRHYTAGALLINQRFTDSSFVEVDSLNPAIIPDSLRKSRIPFRMTVTKQFDRHRLFIVSESMLHVVMQALPLSGSWKGSVSVLDGNNRLFAIGKADFRNLHVTGIDTLQTFSGRFPAWKIQVDDGGAGETWRISQNTGEVLQFEAPYGSEYPRSEVHLVGGIREMQRVAPKKLR